MYGIYLDIGLAHWALFPRRATAPGLSTMPMPNPLNSRKSITWVGMPVKGGIISVESYGCLTSAGEMILLGVFKKHTEELRKYWVRIRNKIITIKKWTQTKIKQFSCVCKSGKEPNKNTEPPPPVPPHTSQRNHTKLKT